MSFENIPHEELLRSNKMSDLKGGYTKQCDRSATCFPKWKAGHTKAYNESHMFISAPLYTPSPLAAQNARMQRAGKWGAPPFDPPHGPHEGESKPGAHAARALGCVGPV